jgi:phage gp36-like protein
MSYASLQDLTDRFGERLLIDLTDRGEEAANTVDTEIVERALADADAQIDGYLMAAGYVLPLSQTPPLVQSLAIDIAIWKLNVFEPGPKVEADYKAAIRSLESIAKGIIRLPVNGAEPADDGSGSAMTTDRYRPMTADNLKGFI